MTPIRAFLLAAACLLPTLGQAATVTLAPTADAYVQNGSNANRNYGTNTQLRVQANNYDSYLKFDTGSATGQVTSAKLRLYASLSKAGNVSSSVRTVADTGWGETTITWNNKPALGAVLGSFSTTSTGYAWKEIDVTAYVQAEKAAGRHVISLGLYSGPSSLVYVRANSRNATSNRPELVIVTAVPNVPPTVSMTSPAGGASYTAPASITLTATATDSDGSIASVAFYNGATLIGTDTSAPYSFAWNNVAAGSYSLTAKATDNTGAATASAPVAVTVTDPPPPVAAGVYYIYADHLNTPRVITDGTNKVVWRWDSDPFGADAANEDPDGDGAKFRYNLRFPGQYYDRETGLHYNYFRDYEPGTGRYVQSDPIGLEGGLNVYAYVDGNPLSYIDPLGLMGWGTGKGPWIKNPNSQGSASVGVSGQIGSTTAGVSTASSGVVWGQTTAIGAGASIDICLRPPPPKACDEKPANPRKPDWYTVGWKNMGITYDHAGSSICLNLGLSTPASMPLGAGWNISPK